MIIWKTYSDPEGSLVDGTSDAGNGVGGVGASGTLLHPLGSDLQLGLAEVGDHPLAVDAEELSNLLAVGGVLDLGLLLLADRDKVLGHVAHVHPSSKWGGEVGKGREGKIMHAGFHSPSCVCSCDSRLHPG